jgi:hypothetical protein
MQEPQDTLDILIRAKRLVARAEAALIEAELLVNDQDLAIDLIGGAELSARRHMLGALQVATTTVGTVETILGKLETLVIETTIPMGGAQTALTQ